MKTTATKGRCVVSALGIFGIFSLTLGALSLGFFEEIIQYFMQKELVLKPGNEYFDIWKELPLPVYEKIYVFNITNPDEFTNNGSKPILEELGPYVYKGRWMKECLGWDEENGTVTYKDIKEYTFVPELSVGDQEAKIYTLNGPLLGVINYAENFTPYFLRPAVVQTINAIFKDYNETLLIHKTIRELLYEGYHEPMVANLTEFIEEFIKLPLKLVNETFGIFHERKHVGDGVFTIKSGANGIKDFTSIQKWNNQTSLDWWNDDVCDKITGTDGAQYPPGVTKDMTLGIFIPHLCRSLPLQYENDVTIHGIKTLRFSLPSNIFATGDVNPENKCYCSGSHCRSGILPLNCKEGAPYVISLPHFFEGEPELANSVLGIKASAKEHKTFLDVEPNTGFVLNAAFKLQVNAVTRKLPDYRPLQHVSENIIPVLYMIEEGQIDAFYANYFKTRVQSPILAFRISCIVCIVIGSFWTLASAVFIFCIQAKVKSDIKPFSVLKTLNSVYTGVALWPPEEDIKESQITEKTH